MVNLAVMATLAVGRLPRARQGATGKRTPATRALAEHVVNPANPCPSSARRR